MAIYTYDPRYWSNFDEGNSLEWVLTAGNGAYAGGSLVGARNRTHQGYLIASLNPPTGRYVVLDQITEYVSLGSKDYDLEASQHKGHLITEGYRYLKRVTYDGTVKFEYDLKELSSDCESGTSPMSVTKHIALVRDENTVAVEYRFINYSADKAEIYLTPKFNCREHNTLSSTEDLKFLSLITGDTLSLVPEPKDDIRIDLSVSEGEFLELADKYDKDVELQTEVDLETEGLCTSYMPYDIRITVAPGEAKTISLICTVNSSGPAGSTAFEDRPAGVLRGEALLEAAVDRFVAAHTSSKLIKQVNEYYDSLITRAHENLKFVCRRDPNASDFEFTDRLILDSDHFIAYRRSTGLKTVLAGLPWFTDWGRDTMIAFTGLCLCTGRFDDAREILKSFALYERNGLIPNMFPDSGEEPLYNTADASLWYFVAVHNYLRYASLNPGEREISVKFIREEIYSVLVNILDAYEHGTDNSIYMDGSGLIHAGSGLDQVTWMDVRVGDMVVTPRHGCPVEINALWYNALRIGAYLADMFDDGDRSGYLNKLADRVRSVFEKIYLSPAGYLYDVVDGYPDYEIKDDSLRPNQLYAVSLPFSPLSDEVKRQISDTVEEHLYAKTGIRSLAPSHPDYHPEYRGALAKRDLSYHQGTAWGYLLGAYTDAYAEVHSGEPDIKDRVRALFTPVIKHQSEANCVGGICEVFDGDAPNTGRGCYTQAWSTGEVLRVWVERYLTLCYNPLE